MCLLAFLALLAATGCQPDRRSGAVSDTRRLAVVSPAAAEMLELLELTDQIVAIGETEYWPESLVDLPSVGRFDAPNSERLIELRVDWLVTTSSRAADDRLRHLESLGVEVLALKTDTFDGVLSSIEQLGARFDREEQAARVVDRIRRDLADISDRTRDLPRPSTLIVVGREPLFVAGPGSHMDEVLKIAGGRNVIEDEGSPYRQFSLEEVLARKPEIILDTTGGAGSWSAFDFLPAVRDGRVYAIDPALVAIPGVRLAEMSLYVAHRVHPNRFEAGDVD
ncbi:MAG: helical backbone metal receptor [Acidobacteriota bacterium]|nr:helical backbone metal receptor [Acidobacteriota bacterium]